MPWSVTLLVGADEHVFTGPAAGVLGRDRVCSIRVATDEKVSRRHCAFDVDPPLLSVRDLGSRNGTFVNGARVTGDQELKDGDELRAGDTTIRVEVRAEPVAGLRVIRELGRGGQGVVHLARHATTGELVAVKTLTAQGEIDPAARTAFVRELDCTKALRHDNIVRFRDSFADPLCFTCEYCAGGSVADLVRHRGGRLPPSEAVPLALQALDGLAYAHQAPVPVRLADGTTTTEHGLVHRDIKPQNLLLAETGLKIADFGLAKAFDKAGLSGHTFTGAMGGSIAFMPRQQIVDYKYATPDVDVWAITACLYWMLTGTTPHDFPPRADPIAIVLRQRPVAIRERLDTVPARLAGLIDHTLDEPPTSATALADALQLAHPAR
ncbi:protein kinase [Actinophytocola sp. NPDC049390]|uniref:protein kinase domain-containing protein n=1 Tax=Actinophytocola sp. NPDC049390 TaxID=3363894 RepID=UPI00378E8624